MNEWIKYDYVMSYHLVQAKMQFCLCCNRRDQCSNYSPRILVCIYMHVSWWFGSPKVVTSSWQCSPYIEFLNLTFIIMPTCTHFHSSKILSHFPRTGLPSAPLQPHKWSASATYCVWISHWNSIQYKGK